MARGSVNVAGGVNPMKDFENAGAFYFNDTSDEGTSRLVVSGKSGWVLAVSNTDGANDRKFRLKIDGVYYIGDASNDMSIEERGQVIIMARFETGFEFYAESNDLSIIYVEGDSFEKTDLKMYHPITSVSALVERLNVTGSGWLISYFNNGTANFELSVDGTTITTGKEVPSGMFLMSRYESGFIVKDSNGGTSISYIPD